MVRLTTHIPEEMKKALQWRNNIIYIVFVYIVVRITAKIILMFNLLVWNVGFKHKYGRNGSLVVNSRSKVIKRQCSCALIHYLTPFKNFFINLPRYIATLSKNGSNLNYAVKTRHNCTMTIILFDTVKYSFKNFTTIIIYKNTIPIH